MKSEIVRTFTEDGIILEGMLCEPDHLPAHSGIVHFHGFAGNFYANPFINYIANEATARGFNFLTVNTRGHDSLSLFHKRSPNGVTYCLYGSVYESFEECVLDIKAWLDFVSNRGQETTVLQGHSVGAMKIAYYQSVNQDQRVKALFFLSPPDMLGNNVRSDRWQKDMEFAIRSMTEGKGNILMPTEAFAYPISAKAFLSYCDPKGKSGVFNFYMPEDPFEVISSISQPIYAVIGNVNEAVSNDVKECMLILEKKATATTSCVTKVIEGASHIYTGKEMLLAETICNWLGQVYG